MVHRTQGERRTGTDAPSGEQELPESDRTPEDTKMDAQARNRSQEDLPVNKNLMLIKQTWGTAKPKAQVTGEFGCGRAWYGLGQTQCII